MAERTPDPNFVFRFQKAYLKDISYESPNASRLLAEPKPQQVSVQLNVTHQAMGATHHSELRRFRCS